MVSFVGRVAGYFTGGGVGKTCTASPKTDAGPVLVGDSVSLSGKTADTAKAPDNFSSGALSDTDGFLIAGSKLPAANSLPERPDRKDYASDTEYDKAYCSFQTANMEKLAKDYPNGIAFGMVYYGCNIPPDEAFKNGIPEKGGSDFDIIRHQREKDKDGNDCPENSALRGSCANASVPAKFAGEGGFVYKLVPLGGAIDLEAAIQRPRHLNPVTLQYEGNMFTGEQEISIGSRQPACQIEGYYEVGSFVESYDCHRLGKFVPNPHFDPQ